MPVANSDFVPGEFMPGIQSAGTLTPGSQGITASETNGPVVGTATVNPTGLPDGAGRGRVSVPTHSGDTSGMADDLPAHTSDIMVGPLDGYLNTGAGDGNNLADAHRYPWQSKPGRNG